MQNSRRSITLLCTATQNLYINLARERIAVEGAISAAHRLFHATAGNKARNRKQQPDNVSALFKPVQVEHNADEIDVGSEIAGKLEKAAVLKILNKFTQRREIKYLCSDNGLDSKFSPTANTNKKNTM